MTIALCHLLDTANAKDVDAEEEEEEEEEEEKKVPQFYISQLPINPPLRLLLVVMVVVVGVVRPLAIPSHPIPSRPIPSKSKFFI